MERKIVTALFISMSMLILFFPVMQETKAISATNSEARLIDLYTQKTPYNGWGLNEPSDAFAPEEEVILYANVTYNLAPVENKLVTFEVNGPPNYIKNVTVTLTASTNASGIATASFGIPWLPEDPETIVFGVWSVCASVEIAEIIVKDTLTFRVGWIVEIISLTTVNKNLQPQTKFAKSTWVGIKLDLRNIAMINKTATLSVVAFDNVTHPIAHAEYDFEIIPGEKVILIPCMLQIPEWAAVRNGTLSANAYTALDVPYCPKASTVILITLLGDLNDDWKVDIKDIAIAALAFGSYPDHPRWNPIADVNQDNKVDIRDIAIVAGNFGAVDC